MHLDYDKNWRQGERVFVRSIGPYRSRPCGLINVHRRAWWGRFNLIKARIDLAQVLTNIAATREEAR